MKHSVHKDVLKGLTQEKEIVKIANGLYGFSNEEKKEASAKVE